MKDKIITFILITLIIGVLGVIGTLGYEVYKEISKEGRIEISFESETGFPTIEFIPKEEDKLNFTINDDMFEGEEGFRIEESEFEANGKKTLILYCEGHCDRRKRPLSCRIFPLVPYAKRGEKMEIIMDVRGKGMCPLATAMKKEDLSYENDF